MSSSTLDNMHVHVKLKLSALWTAIMFCYIYGDFWGLYRPGQLKAVLEGRGLLDGPTGQGTLLAVSILVAVPAVMIFLSLVLPPRVGRWLNIAFGTALTIIVLLTLAMPGAWIFYIFMSVVEVVMQILIVWYAWKWPRQVSST
jgi:hypothetical protein